MNLSRRIRATPVRTKANRPLASVEGKIWLCKQPIPLECFEQPRFVSLTFGQPPAENRVNIVLGHKFTLYRPFCRPLCFSIAFPFWVFQFSRFLLLRRKLLCRDFGCYLGPFSGHFSNFSSRLSTKTGFTVSRYCLST